MTTVDDDLRGRIWRFDDDYDLSDEKIEEELQDIGEQLYSDDESCDYKEISRRLERLQRCLEIREEKLGGSLSAFKELSENKGNKQFFTFRSFRRCSLIGKIIYFVLSVFFVLVIDQLIKGEFLFAAKCMAAFVVLYFATNPRECFRELSILFRIVFGAGMILFGIPLIVLTPILVFIMPPYLTIILAIIIAVLLVIWGFVGRVFRFMFLR